MFESAELGHKIDKATYDREVPLLREALLDAQLDLALSGKFPVIILLGGLDGAGRGETLNLLNEWMDPRHIQSHGMGEPSDEELDRPMMWRFWRALPPKGKIGVFLGSWYTWPILNRVNGITKAADLDQSMERAKRLEKMLTDEGTLILKFWLHLSREKQEKRLKALEKDPKTRWRVTDRDWEHFKLYDKFRAVNESVIRHTSTAEAPWFIVEGEDPRYRSLTIGKMIQEAIRRRLDADEKPPASINAPPLLPPIDQLQILKTLDLTQKLEKKEFEEELEKYQGKLALLTRHPRFREITVIAV
ncbi:MAG: polyphosphate:AMP phosphotransferase, partial [Sulfurimicrobium sp.]